MFSTAETPCVDNMGVLSLKAEIDASDDEIDCDTVSEEILNTSFEKGDLLTEKLISKQAYVLHLDGTK